MTEALVIVDVQRGFIRPSTEHVPARVEKLQGDFEYVYATQFINRQPSGFTENIGWRRLVDTSETEMAFPVAAKTCVVRKHVYSCVNSEFIHDLIVRQVETIYTCGIDTDICVLKISADLFDFGFRVKLLADACGSTAGADHHEAALGIIGRFIGRGNVLR